LLVHFVRGADIAPEQIEELKRLLDEKRPCR
jgi:predicted transcriptional regulator